MRLKDLLKFNKRIKELPQYTPKSDLPEATKAMREKNLKDFFSKEKNPKERFGWFSAGGFRKDKSLTAKDKIYYEKRLAKAEKTKHSKLDWRERDDNMVKAMEKAYERKDKKALGGWLKAWAKEDRRDLKRFEKDLMRD